MPPDILLQVYGILDYFIQAVLFAFGFIFPWFTPRNRGWTLVVYPIVLAFAWGFWRMFFFDRLFNNDVIPMGYLASGFMLAGIGWVFFRLRWAISYFFNLMRQDYFTRKQQPPAEETHPR
jgi:hypothetical protein